MEVEYINRTGTTTFIRLYKSHIKKLLNYFSENLYYLRMKYHSHRIQQYIHSRTIHQYFYNSH